MSTLYIRDPVSINDLSRGLESVNELSGGSDRELVKILHVRNNTNIL